MTLNRRTLLAALATLPFIGKGVTAAAEPTRQELRDAIAVEINDGAP